MTSGEKAFGFAVLIALIGTAVGLGLRSVHECDMKRAMGVSVPQTVKPQKNAFQAGATEAQGIRVARGGSVGPQSAQTIKSKEVVGQVVSGPLAESGFFCYAVYVQEFNQPIHLDARKCPLLVIGQKVMMKQQETGYKWFDYIGPAK